MSGRILFYELMLNTELLYGNLKECFSAGALRIKPVGKLGTVICLEAFNGVRESLYTVLDEFRKRIRIVLFESFQIAKTAVFAYERVLVIVSTILFDVLNSRTY